MRARYRPTAGRLRALVHDAARGDPGATAMLLSMLRAVENVLRDVESALARRN